MVEADAFGKLELELRRGVVVLATLSQLRAARYGYELRQALADKGMPIEEGTLYPLLARMARRGWLKASQPKRSRDARVYRITPAGAEVLKRLRAALAELQHEVGRDAVRRSARKTAVKK